MARASKTGGKNTAKARKVSHAKGRKPELAKT